ncbi:MAG: hypothetical protein ACJ749_06780 [Flavisolibacter sp.]
MIFQSDDYNKFNMIKGNRTIDMNKIKRILADIERGTNLLSLCPIIVVENKAKLDIVDGQHRYLVAKKKKHPVHYIIGNQLSLYDIARMNSNTEKWKFQDFITCYVELGNDNYKKLQKFMQEFPKVPITSAIALLGAGKVTGGGNINQGRDGFQKGLFVVKEEKRAATICNKINLFTYENKWARSFMQAVVKVMDSDKFSIDDLITKVNENTEMLQLHDHWRKYLTNMEEIVSKGKHKRVAIY